MAGEYPSPPKLVVAMATVSSLILVSLPPSDSIHVYKVDKKVVKRSW